MPNAFTHASVARHPRQEADQTPALTPRSAEDIREGLKRHLAPRADAAPIRFEFACAGVHYQVLVESGEQPSVVLHADLGALPFTIEIGEARRLATRIVTSSARLAHGQLMLTPEQDIALRAQASVPQPLTPESILATVTALALNVKPYLALLAQALELGRRRAADEPVA